MLADLCEVDRKRTPWLIALFHVPWYNSNTAHQGEGDEMMSYMEPLLYVAGVDMVLAGHVHAYERSNRVYGGKSDRCGAVHVTIGDVGNSEGLAQRYQTPDPSGQYSGKQVLAMENSRLSTHTMLSGAGIEMMMMSWLIR